MDKDEESTKPDSPAQDSAARDSAAQDSAAHWPRSFARRLASSGFWALFGKIASIVSVLLNYRVLCEHLSPAELAIYVVACGATSLGALLCGCGLGTATLRRLSMANQPDANQSDDGPLLFREGLVVHVLLLASVAWVLVASGLLTTLHLRPFFFGQPLSPVIFLIVGWMATRCCLALMTETARGLQHFSLAAGIGGMQEGPIVNLLVLMTFLVLGDRITTAGDALHVHLVASSTIAISTLIVTFRLMRRIDRERPGQSHRTWFSQPTTSLLGEGGKVLVSQLAIHGIVEVETLLIGKHCSADEIGAWGLIRRLMSVVSAPLLLINASIPSFVAELYGKGEKAKMEKLLRGAATIASPPAIIAFVALFFLGKPLLASYDPQFVTSWLPLMLLAGANIVFVAAGSAGLTLRMTNRQGWATTSTLALGVIYLMIAPWVIKHHQLLGAAIIAAAMIVLRNTISTVLVRVFLKIWCIPSPDVRQVGSVVSIIRNRRKRPSKSGD